MAVKRGRRSGAYSQSDRLARMIRALASRAMTVKELAADFGISRRQAYRELKRLQEEGHPLEQSDGDGEKTWRLPLGYQGFRPITVSPYELLALHFAKKHIEYVRDTPFADDLDRLIQNVEAGLPHKVFNHLSRINQVFLPRQGPLRDYAAQAELLKALQQALLLQRSVRLSHRRPGYDEPTDHRVDPYRLLLYQCGLYLVGYSHRAEAMRMFAVERIVSAAVLTDRFTIPAHVQLDRVYEGLFGLIEEPTQCVRIKFSSDAAYLVQERRWHPSQANERQADGSIIATFMLGGMEEFTAWVLSWGREAKVLEPPALVDAVKAQLAGALERYP